MMFSKSTVAVLVCQALAAIAAPADIMVEARGVTAADAPAGDSGESTIMADASIYMCKDIRWNGGCINVLIPLDTCRNVPSGWNDVISSIRNDSKSFYTCTWYLDANCSGGSYGNQEDANLADGNGRFNDSISSYSCKRK